MWNSAAVPPGTCSAGRLMRTGSAFWPLPGSCTPISVAAAPWTSSSGKAALAQAEAILQGSGTGSRRVSASSPEGLCLTDSSLQTLCSQRGLFLQLLVAFFLYECFKEDVCQPGAAELLSHDLTPPDRHVAGKIVRHADRLESNGGHLEAEIDRLWRKSAHPPPFAWV